MYGHSNNRTRNPFKMSGPLKAQLYIALLMFTFIQIGIVIFYVMLSNTSVSFNGRHSFPFHKGYHNISPLANHNAEMNRNKVSMYFSSDNYGNNLLEKTSFNVKFHRCPEMPWWDENGGFVLENDTNDYFIQMGNLICFFEGTNLTSNASTFKATKCPCLQNWYGTQCSIPQSVKDSTLPNRYIFTSRLKNPRRVINAFPFNIEFAMLEARLAEFGDIIDVFLILESNYTAYGHPKPLNLLERLRKGKYKKYACKIVHIFLNFFPQNAHKDGWIADTLLRDYIGQHGLTQQLKGYKHDDVFILNDADEIPLRETILFLKLHDGYPEPFAFNLHWTIYGFFWRKGITQKFSGSTVGMLRHVFHDKIIKIRSADHFITRQGAKELDQYLHHGSNVLVYPWTFGNEQQPAGWHCSWCCDPKCIQNKLLSAQNGDFPRWGDFPNKLNLTYISNLIKMGIWFDDTTKFIKITPESIPMYAPNHFLKHKDYYQNILFNPFRQEQSASLGGTRPT